MKILCTFSGKFGDILWALPTVREIMKQNGTFNGPLAISDTEMHFGIMPAYRSLLPLLNTQNYISKAFVIENWICTGSPHGDQPWEAPVLEGYDKVYHLGYRNHPSKDQPLIDFTASQQGIKLENPIPFLSLPEHNFKGVDHPLISYAFNDSMKEEKDRFINEVKNRIDIELNGTIGFVEITSNIPWLDAAAIINKSICFIGCRSANYVLACGLGQKVFVYEPNVARSKFGPWGTTFTCPYADETEISYVSIYQLVDYVKSKIVEVVK